MPTPRHYYPSLVLLTEDDDCLPQWTLWRRSNGGPQHLSSWQLTLLDRSAAAQTSEVTVVPWGRLAELCEQGRCRYLNPHFGLCVLI